jgi:hypothetical protein
MISRHSSSETLFRVVLILEAGVVITLLTETPQKPGAAVNRLQTSLRYLITAAEVVFDVLCKKIFWL